ncbi:leucine-rich repeat domain-containing protein [Kribbella ginsengisoli]
MESTAGERVARAARDAAQSLDLSGLALTSVPLEICELTSLTELNLDGNQLVSLPDGLARLTSLRHLYISRNRLTHMPDCLANLQSLWTLALDDNQIETLPTWLGRLRDLVLLSLDGNRIVALPDSLGELDSLLSLRLSENKIETLPTTFNRLESLTSLQLDGNRLRDLPSSFGDLVSLTELDLSRNDLTVLPEPIGRLPALTSLQLRQNQIADLPSTVDLTALTELDLHQNPVKVIGGRLIDFSLLHDLVDGDDLEGLRALCTSGWNVDECEPWTGATALLLACVKNRAALVRLLLQYHADPNAIHSDGYNCYDSTSSWAIRRMLVEAGFGWQPRWTRCAPELGEVRHLSPVEPIDQTMTFEVTGTNLHLEQQIRRYPYPTGSVRISVIVRGPEPCDVLYDDTIVTAGHRRVALWRGESPVTVSFSANLRSFKGDVRARVYCLDKLAVDQSPSPGSTVRAALPPWRR